MWTLVGRNLIKTSTPLLGLLSLILLSFVVTGCLNEGSGSEDNTQVVAVPDDSADGQPDEEPLPPLTPPERTLCDPFSAGTSARDRGLIGNLLYLTDEMPRYSRVADFIDNAIPIESTLYFDQIYVPTRSWDLGFYTQDGVLVTNQNDEPVYEYFALRLESQMTLSAAQEAGWYQMAVLSDDGAVLSERKSDGSIAVIVDNDGNHPTRMGCASEAIYMDHNTRRKIIMEYYQGPRYHISNIVMWRKLANDEDPANPNVDSQCGRQGNSMYFDWTKTPSEPTATYYELMTRGWQTLGNENYYFPEQASNPCAQEEPLVITNFAINSTARTQVTVSWNTSLPATRQVEVKNVVTGQIQLSTIDSSMSLNHTVTFTGLSANTLYAIKGLATTASGQTAVSSELAFRTPR